MDIMIPHNTKIRYTATEPSWSNPECPQRVGIYVYQGEDDNSWFSLAISKLDPMAVPTCLMHRSKTITMHEKYLPNRKN